MRVAVLVVGEAQRAPDIRKCHQCELGRYSKEEKAPGDASYQEFEKWGQMVSIHSGELDGYC